MATETRPSPDDIEPGWDKRQVKDFVKAVRKQVGDGWSWLTPRVQRALISERAFHIVRGQATDSVAVVKMDRLLNDMLAEAGLEDEP